MKAAIVFTYDEKDHSYIVSENGCNYVMPGAYALLLKRFLRDHEAAFDKPVAAWYSSLRDIEKRIVEKKSSDAIERKQNQKSAYRL
jgi:hypothetical protein